MTRARLPLSWDFDRRGDYVSALERYAQDVTVERDAATKEILRLEALNTGPRDKPRSCICSGCGRRR